MSDMIRSLLKSLLVLAVFVPVAAALPLAALTLWLRGKVPAENPFH